MANLSATPYAYGGKFFFFESLDEYEAKYKKNVDKDTGVPYEEYEIDFQDGDEHEALIFKVLSTRSYGLPQNQIEKYFELVDEIDENDAPALAYLVEDLGYDDIEEAISKVEEVQIQEGDAKDAVYDFVDSMGGVSELGKRTTDMYFDYDKFGRDLRIEGALDPTYDEDNFPVQEEPSEDDYEDEDDYEEAVEQYDDYVEAQKNYDRMDDEDIGYEYVEMVGELDDTTAERYFDYESFARDLVLNGDWSETRINNTDYTITNAAVL